MGRKGVAALGLAGPVTRDRFDALYGPGGAKDPTTRERLVSTKRPGMELVIAAHKSVAELGVIGRAEDMHRIMDAERDATLAYLDRLTCDVGGRRGRAGTPTPTSGLVYGVTRHATSRAGDPNPHDHVLIANVLQMRDERGGWKAATTALWREHLQAATMVGRMAGAYEAQRLGYGIVADDDGPTGKLRHWAIAGVPDEVIAVHSKRAAEITAEMDRLGYHSYVAKGIVARDTRAQKRHQPVGKLMPRWQAELESVGWPVTELARAVEDQRRRWSLRQRLDRHEERKLIADVLAPDGPLAERKVFARRDAIVALAPRLYGLHPAALEEVADRVLANPESVPLVAVPAASERPYATTIAREQAIAAAVVIEVARRDAPAVPAAVASMALVAREHELGKPVTAGQRQAVLATATSGRGGELIVGLAGSGKTTALAAVRETFETEGYRVIGTSTSGQAARTLGRAAGIEPSRTLASLTWRLEHGQVSLDNRTVVVLDEAAMPHDRSMLQLLHHAARAHAKVVMSVITASWAPSVPAAASKPSSPASAARCTSWPRTCASATSANVRHWRSCVTATLPKLLPGTRVTAVSSWRAIVH